jgi:hypothetical protein
MRYRNVKGKTVLLWEWYQWGEGRVKEGRHGQCILQTYENRTMKPVEVVLRRDGRK